MEIVGFPEGCGEISKHQRSVKFANPSIGCWACLAMEKIGRTDAHENVDVKPMSLSFVDHD